jgi:hypothetical protein
MGKLQRLAGGILAVFFIVTTRETNAQEIYWVPVYSDDALWQKARVLEFDIVNRGKKELKVDRVRAACSCSRTFLATNAVGPGQSSRLRVWLREDAARSEKPSSVYVHSNDIMSPVIRIPVDPMNRAGLKCVPERILFKCNKGQYEPAQQTVRIRLQEGLSITVLRVRNPSPYISIPTNAFVSTQSNACLVVIADANMAPRESESRTIGIIYTFGKDVESSIEVPLDIIVDDIVAKPNKPCLSCSGGAGAEVAVAPGELHVSRKEADNGCDRIIRIVAAGDMPFSGIEMQVWGGQITLQNRFPEMLLPGERAECQVRIMAGTVPDSGSCSAICIRGVAGERRVFKVIPLHIHR